GISHIGNAVFLCVAINKDSLEVRSGDRAAICGEIFGISNWLNLANITWLWRGACGNLLSDTLCNICCCICWRVCRSVSRRLRRCLGSGLSWSFRLVVGSRCCFGWSLVGVVLVCAEFFGYFLVGGDAKVYVADRDLNGLGITNEDEVGAIGAFGDNVHGLSIEPFAPGTVFLLSANEDSDNFLSLPGQREHRERIILKEFFHRAWTSAATLGSDSGVVDDDGVAIAKVGRRRRRLNRAGASGLGIKNLVSPKSSSRSYCSGRQDCGHRGSPRGPRGNKSASLLHWNLPISYFALNK